MKLIIVRHGETEDNAKKIIQGQNPGKLSALGKEQAKKVASRLKNEKIDFIYCSDLGRAKETLVPIVESHQNIPTIYEPMLRERKFGVFDGKTMKDYKQAKDAANDRKWRPENGENFYDVKRRIRKFLKHLLKNHSGNDTILIITHGGWKGTFFSQIMQIPREKAFFLQFDNTSVSKIELRGDGKHKFGVINCTKHLD
jgi:broad specificity phosphatase PhoE